MPISHGQEARLPRTPQLPCRAQGANEENSTSARAQSPPVTQFCPSVWLACKHTTESRAAPQVFAEERAGAGQQQGAGLATKLMKCPGWGQTHPPRGGSRGEQNGGACEGSALAGGYAVLGLEHSLAFQALFYSRKLQDEGKHPGCAIYLLPEEGEKKSASHRRWDRRTQQGCGACRKDARGGDPKTSCRLGPRRPSEK